MVAATLAHAIQYPQWGLNGHHVARWIILYWRLLRIAAPAIHNCDVSNPLVSIPPSPSSDAEIAGADDKMAGDPARDYGQDALLQKTSSCFDAGCMLFLPQAWL